jgi:transcriptional regulator with XRE-family HTH domain
MPGARRKAIVVQAEARWRERRLSLGRDVRGCRRRRHWSQQELADRAGLGASMISRLERGVVRVDLEMLERIGMALGVALVVAFGRDRLEDVADAGHLKVQELVLGLTRAAGYTAQFELPTKPSEPWRSIDVACGDPRRRLAIEIECWNGIGDVGAAARATARKTAELEALVTARWGEGARARSVWVVRATARNQQLLARYPEVFAARFPGSSRHWVEALTAASEPPEEPGLVWCDVGATRLFEWRRWSA